MECILFSIIVVCRNEEKRICHTIESVLQQTYAEWECIVIDGASTDCTVQLVNGYLHDQRMQCISEPDTGVYNAMNKGIANAKGDYLFFLNAGDIFWDAKVLTEIAKGIAVTNADIIIGNYVEKKHEIENVIMTRTNWTELVQSGNSICHQAVFAKRECLQGGFDEQYHIVADYDWFCRQIKKGCIVCWWDVVISKYDAYGMSSMACKWKETQEECIQIVEKYFPENVTQIRGLKAQQFQQIKMQRNYECMNDMLALKQKGNSIAGYFCKRNIKKVAIYGFHYIGQRVRDELEAAGLDIRFVIDNAAAKMQTNQKILMLTDELEEVDMIIITPIFDFYEIAELLKTKTSSPVVSIETAIHCMYEE